MKMGKTWALLAIASLDACMGFGAIVLTAPAEKSTVTVLKPLVRECMRLDETNSMAFTRRNVAKIKAEGDRPQPVVLAWTGADRADVHVVRTGDGGVEFSTNGVTGGKVEVSNLRIACDYTWTVSANGQSASASFVTEDLPPRWVDWPGIPNARDLGGWKTVDGKRVRQGVLYRSAGLNENATKSESGEMIPGELRGTAESRAWTVGHFGLKADVDLRRDREVFGMDGSPLGKKVVWVQISGSDCGNIGAVASNARGGRTRKALVKTLRTILDDANRPLVFHCIHGADRTGAVAFYLNALLGVSLENLGRDFELTTWSGSVRRRDSNAYREMLAEFQALAGRDAREKAEGMFRSSGVTQEEIAKFRSLMLEDL